MRPLVFMLVLLTAGELLAEDDPLHQVIDKHLAAAGDEAPVCRDAEFLRRVSLDLIGLPPTADEVRAFVADPAGDKRTRAVDRLLESPLCDRHLTATLDLMLMERRANQHVPQDSWHNWLFQQVRERRPWNQIVSEILQADGDDSATRPAARFFLDRQSEPHLLTRDVGRIFFGRDLQCAQCHNHPLFDDYLQVDYHGLHAFLAPGYAVVRKIKKKEGDKETTTDVTVHAEKAGSDLTFESVFFEGTTRRTGPRLPDDVSISEEFRYPGDEYEVEPAEGIKSVPRISRRAKLAELATSGSNRMFNENIANRLWAHMLGRGLVHPVDLHHFENPPTDPDLLRILGQQFAAMDFDVRGFLREIALSRGYQRPFDRPQDLIEVASTATALLAERALQIDALEKATTDAADACELATEHWDEAQEALVPVAAEVDQARKVYDEARKALKSAEDALAKTTAELQMKQQAFPSVQQAATASRTAADLIKDDAELRAAAELLAKRVDELQESVTQLTATADEQTKATEGPRTDFVKKKQSVDEVLAKLPPLDAALREFEAVLLEKRRLMQRQKTELAAVQNEVETLQELAELPVLHEAVRSASETRTKQMAERDVAHQQLTAQLAVVEQIQESVTQLEQTLADADRLVEQANNLHAERAKPVLALQATIDAAEAAQRTLNDDPVLAEVTSKLQERLLPLQEELDRAQLVVEVAVQECGRHNTAHNVALQSLNEAVSERERRQAVLTQAEGSTEHARAVVVEAEASLDSAVGDLTERWTADFTMASLKPLTPEQMCWSLLRVTGVYNRQRQAEADKLAAESPMTDDQRNDALQVADRRRQIEQKSYDTLKTHVGTFVKYYGAAAGQPQNDFFATADQALFVANAGVLNSWVAPAAGNVTERVIKAETADTAAEELYLAVLNRHPSEQETAEVADLLATGEQDRETIAKELVWGLMTSIEFRFNH